MENLGKFTVFIISIVVAVIVRGFVLTKLWAWFIVPVFELSPLRIVEAIGISTLIGYLTYSREKGKEDDDFWKKFIESLVVSIVLALLSLGMGWIISLFI